MFVPLEIIILFVTAILIPLVVYIWRDQTKKVSALNKALDKLKDDMELQLKNHIEKADQRLDSQDERMSDMENNYKSEFKEVNRIMLLVRDEIISKLHRIEVGCAAVNHHVQSQEPITVPPALKQG
jgi:hypothetical protein